MKDNKNEKFYKAKGFYICLASGLFAILAMVAVQNNLNEDKNYNDNLANLNEVAQEQKTITQQEQQQVQKTEEQINLLENDIVEDLTATPKEAAKNETKKDTSSKGKSKTADKTKEEETVSVISNEVAPQTQDFANEDQGLLWPVNGNIIMKYSMDKGIYFSTLGQYKCNPAIMIAGKVGDAVVSAADGKVTDIVTNEETGLTITTNIGQYDLIYGQLKDVKVATGDTIKEGQTLGYLAEPSKYYTVEGCNLYFKVMEEDTSINPLLLLK